MIRTILLLAGLLAMPQWTVPLHHPYVPSGAACTTVPFSDNFTRANGPLGSPWTQFSGGTIAIVSNQANPGAFNATDVAWPTGCPYSGADRYAQITVGSITAAIGPALYVTDANNYYYVQCSGGGCTALDWIGGTNNFIGSFAHAGPVAGDVVCAEITGGVLKLKFNHGSYDAITFTVSGLSAAPGGMFFNAGSATASTITNFQTGNSPCP